MTKASQILIPYLSMHPLRVVARHEGGFGRILIVQGDDGEKHALKTLKADLGIDQPSPPKLQYLSICLPIQTSSKSKESSGTKESLASFSLPCMAILEIFSANTRSAQT